MTKKFWSFLCFLSRAVLSLRYKIEVRGMKTLEERLKRKGGILFLPNHPAHMDPLFITLLLWPRFRMRPLVIEYVFRQPGFKPFMNLVGALSIPNFETSINQLKVRKAEQAVTVIAEGLEQGGNFMLYPSGRLKSSGKEMLRGASAAHSLVQACPNANIVLIRTTGLWGSSFSRVVTGRSPDLKKTLAKGVLTTLKNFIFFLPRRKIVIEIEGEPEGLPRDQERTVFNRFLESWYNRYPDEKGEIHEAEPVKLVSYSFWKEDLAEVYKPTKRKGADNGPISPEIQKKICSEIARVLEKPDLEINPEMNLAYDLGMDSLQIAELVGYISQHFEIDEIHPDDLETVQSVLEIAQGARTSEKSEHPGVKFYWPDEKGRPPPVLPQGETIPEAFLHACERMDGFSACGDDLIGVMSYKRLKRACLVFAEHFKTFPEERIGVLLPSSVGAFIVILGLQMAGKVPVMLNWTLGPRALDDMVKTAEIKTIISSWRFLEKLSHVDFGEATDRIQLLEDIRQNLSLKTKLSGLFTSFLGRKAILRKMGLNSLDENKEAVVLFTSGTEASPKGVPLSHKNIISNLRAGTQCIELKSTDLLYAVLPPFHSFGFTVAGLFSFLGGMKIALFPDPTDSFALAEGIERWKATIFCSAPSFLKGLFQSAKKEQLSTMRYFITGAEKTPQELYDRVAKLGNGAIVIEGYGITECSPILTICRPNFPAVGVGRPLPGVEYRTIHAETLEPLADGAEGELCVRGPSIFKGYLGHQKSPFIEIDGQSWYRTGDIGYFDKDSNFVLSGRLKRFTKIGGEMISLGAVEETLNSELLRQGRIDADAPSLAVCAEEEDGKQPHLILFSTAQLEKDEVNDVLRQSGMGRIIKISRVRKVEEIPLLGTGKINYRGLMASLTA
jgi:long-chain-fatty-acid--[acyl-carrier-protein] ligase